MWGWVSVLASREGEIQLEDYIANPFQILRTLQEVGRVAAPLPTPG